VPVSPWIRTAESTGATLSTSEESFTMERGSERAGRTRRKPVTYSTSPVTPGTPDSLVTISTTTGAVTQLISESAASQPLVHPVQ